MHNKERFSASLARRRTAKKVVDTDKAMRAIAKRERSPLLCTT
jgi:hypothetical protein